MGKGVTVKIEHPGADKSRTKALAVYPELQITFLR